MIGISDIWEAKKRIRDYVHVTPLVGSENIGSMAGSFVYFKCENMQKTGSFKARGAFNRILSLSDEKKERGVCCYSSGNHAQAVCYAARTLGVKAYVWMPETATESKIEACRAYGGEITLYGKTGGDCAPLAKEFSEKNGVFYIDPCEDPYIMAGQGTAGLEIMEVLPDVDTVYCQVGGGGLMSGVATAIKSLSPDTKIIGVEPETMNCMSNSIHAGKISPIERQYSIADGLAGSAPGPNAFEICSGLLDDIITVSDDEIARATKLIIERCKLTAEPSGAAALAGLLSGKSECGRKTVCMISGGNYNKAVLSDILANY